MKVTQLLYRLKHYSNYKESKIICNVFFKYYHGLFSHHKLFAQFLWSIYMFYLAVSSQVRSPYEFIHFSSIHILSLLFVLNNLVIYAYTSSSFFIKFVNIHAPQKTYFHYLYFTQLVYFSTHVNSAFAITQVFFLQFYIPL